MTPPNKQPIMSANQIHTSPRLLPSKAAAISHWVSDHTNLITDAKHKPEHMKS